MIPKQINKYLKLIDKHIYESVMTDNGKKYDGKLHELYARLDVAIHKHFNH